MWNYLGPTKNGNDFFKFTSHVGILGEGKGIKRHHFLNTTFSAGFVSNLFLFTEVT